MMKTRELLRAILYALALLSGANSAVADVDQFKYFFEEGIFDPGVSNELANSLVSEAIATDDPEVVESTIRALGIYAGRDAEGLSGPESPLPSRSFADVKGLKEFLQAHWRAKLAESGYNSAEAKRNDREQFYATLGSRSIEGHEEEPSLEQPSSAYLKVRIPWPMIPKMLCVFWPEDPSVLELVWENQANNRAANVTLQTLGLLNVGGFRGPEADSFRIRQLKLALEDKGALASIAVMQLAEGLTYSNSSEALPLLISAGMKHPSARTEVMIALSSWDEEQLQAHAQALRPLVERYQSRRPMGADVEAHERLKAVLDLESKMEEPKR